MQRTTIDWPGLTHTWNPVMGCRHGCSYCYAKRMNDRFKWISKWNSPKFFPGRAHEPNLLRHPAKIFVGSMCDLFGEWVPREWIEAAIDAARCNSRHTFMFLTKNPKRYWDFSFPKNCQLGTTITCAADLPRVDYLKRCDAEYKFVSVEPLIGPIPYIELHSIMLIIVGAMTGRGAVKPERKWLEDLVKFNVYFKQNAIDFLRGSEHFGIAMTMRINIRTFEEIR